MRSWSNGMIADFQSVDTGSIPVGRSKIPS